jgi:hypothetical protein
MSVTLALIGKVIIAAGLLIALPGGALVVVGTMMQGDDGET